MKKILSKTISRVFDPVLLIPLGLGMAIWFSLAGGLRWRALVLILAVDALLPFIFMMIALAKGQISSWDIRERSERIPLYLFTLFVHGVGILIADYLDKGDLARILLVFWLIAAAFAVVTTKWKISLHAGVNAVLSVFVNMVYGWHYWYLLLIVPIVGWARVYDKHHSWQQVAVGALVGGGVTYLGMMIVGV